jgi:hypothetical protein
MDKPVQVTIRNIVEAGSRRVGPWTKRKAAESRRRCDRSIGAPLGGVSGHDKPSHRLAAALRCRDRWGVKLGHRVRLEPTPGQDEYFRRAWGVARFAYNWALTEWRRQFATGGRPSEAALCRRLNGIKAESYPWMLAAVLGLRGGQRGPDSGPAGVALHRLRSGARSRRERREKPSHRRKFDGGSLWSGRRWRDPGGRVKPAAKKQEDLSIQIGTVLRIGVGDDLYLTARELP